MITRRMRQYIYIYTHNMESAKPCILIVKITRMQPFLREVFCCRLCVSMNNYTGTVHSIINQLEENKT